MKNLNNSIKLLNDNNQLILMQFLSKFILCEIYCKQVISDYYNEDFENIELHMSRIKCAFINSDYDIDESLLNKLFSSNNKLGEQSIKKLRDKFVHELKYSSINEILNRYSELCDIMDSFLKYFN